MKTEIERFAPGNGWIDTRWRNGAFLGEVNVRNWGLSANVRWYPPQYGRLPVVVAVQIGPFSAALYMGKG